MKTCSSRGRRMNLDSSRQSQQLVCCLNLSPDAGLSWCPSPWWCPASVWSFPLMEEALGTTHTWIVTAMGNIHLLGAIKLPGKSVPWLLFCLLEQCKSGPIRFFLQMISEKIVQASSCISSSLSLSLLFFNFLCMTGSPEHLQSWLPALVTL